jgi:hypothetical protein
MDITDVMKYVSLLHNYTRLGSNLLIGETDSLTANLVSDIAVQNFLQKKCVVLMILSLE